MPGRLDVYFADLPIRRFLLEEGRDYLLGRDAGCDLAVNDPRISRRHARLEPAGTGWRVVDLESKNGTWVDGRPAGEAGELAAGAWLSLGGMPARFERVSEEAGRQDLAREHLRWQTSLELTRRIDPGAGLDALLAEILASVREVSGCERCLVMLSRPDGELELAASVGLTDRELAAPAFAGSRSAIEQALSEARPVTAVDARVDTVLGGRPSVVQGGLACLVCLPLQVLDRLIGVLYADSREPGSGFTELDVGILTALSSHAALAIAMARLAREVDAVRASVPAPEGAAGQASSPALTAAWDRSVPSYRPAGTRDTTASTPRPEAPGLSTRVSLNGHVGVGGRKREETR